MNTINEKDQLLAYLNANGASGPKVIPGTDEVTFFSKQTGIPQVWKWKDSNVRQYSDLGDRVMSVYHSPSGTKTIVGMDHEGNEKQQLFLLTEDGTNAEELVVSNDHFHRFGGWSPNEGQIAFASNRRHPGYFDVYLYDLKTKKEAMIFPFNGSCSPLCWTKDGQHLIISLVENNISQTLHLLHVETGKLTKLGEDGPDARFHSVELLDNGSGGFVLSDFGLDTMAIFQFSLQEPAKLEKLFAIEGWDLEEIKLSPDGSKVAFTVNEGGISKLGIYYLDEKNHEFVAGLPSGVYDSLSWFNENELVVGVKSAVLPGDIWKVSLKEKTAERLTYVGEDKSISHRWVEPELYSFSSFDGLEVPYFLYGKKADSPAQPVVVYVHGGPEGQIKSEYHPVIQYLAGKGFMVAAPNVRGSMGYGRKYLGLDDVRKRMDSVADLKCLVDDLVDSHGVHRGKVGIMGRSYGGFMVLASLTHYPDVWAAGVDIVGISHFKSFLENTGAWRRKIRESEYGSLEHDVDFFEEIAPLNHTDKIKAPLLVFHGRNDMRVPVSEAEQLTEDLKKQGKQVELIIFEDEGHQTEKIENHITMNTRIVEFFEREL